MYRKNFLPVVTLIVVAVATWQVIACNSNKRPGKQDIADSIQHAAGNDSFHPRPLTNIKFEASAQRLKQGAYLANSILMCFTCHSPRNWDAPGGPPIEARKGSGGTIVGRDSTSLVIAPNITPDKETGAGNWTDDMLARAIREGVGHDGRVLSWQMPYFVFNKLSDEDLASVTVYLRSLPALHNIVPATKISEEERSRTEKYLRPLKGPIPTPDMSVPVKRGQYLVSIGECVNCHTASTEYNPGLFGGGNLPHRYEHAAFAANITIDPAGIDYGPAGLISVLRTGKGATLNPVMPWIAFRNLTDDDINAIYAYLRTIPPSHHHVSNSKPFTHCAICGQEHGLGDKNKRVNLTGIKVDPSMLGQFSGTYFNAERNSSYIIFKSEDKLFGKPSEDAPKTELVPQSETRFLAAGWVLPVDFIKDKDGHVTALQEETNYGMLFKKIK